MKLPKTILMLGLVTAVVGSSVTANAQDDGRLFGNGRFLRRLTGKSEPKPQPKVQPKAAAKKQPTKAVPRVRPPAKSTKPRTAPTPARKPGQPNFAEPNFGKSKSPNPNVRKPSTSSRPTALNAPNRASKPRGDVESNFRNTASEDNNSVIPPAVTQSAKKPTLGFGMLIETRGDNMVVTKIDPKGNAHEAGVRTGDQVLSAGGVKLESMEEFNGITDILGEGDQLEFKIVRRGKKQERLIQFGKTPEPDAPAPKEPANNNTASRASSIGSGLRSVMDEGNNRQPTASRTASPLANQTIERQRLEIERMKREIERLRQSQAASTIEPAISAGRTILNGPTLSGPKK